MAAILLVDDEPAIRESLAFALRRDGFEVEEATTLREARNRAESADLVILDLVLPDGSGLLFLRSLRERSDVPVIVLTSRDEETDRVVGLELGADDYVLKPFSPREVAARVRAVLRRASKAAQAEDKPIRAGADRLVLRLGRLRRPAQHRPHPSGNLARREGLEHVVVRAQLQADHAVRLLVPAGEDDHGHVAPFPQ